MFVISWYNLTGFYYCLKGDVVMTRKLFSMSGVLLCLLGVLFCLPVMAEEAPPEASVNGKYSELIQVLPCPRDGGSYGEFRDYGHWGGGAWCGQTGKAGYWVWVAPNWYVWKHKGARAADGVPHKASANGKYSGLVQVMNCPKDRGSYGKYRDYGWWGGGAWCGQTGKAGYWVWVAPKWYVWSNQN